MKRWYISAALLLAGVMAVEANLLIACGCVLAAAVVMPKRRHKKAPPPGAATPRTAKTKRGLTPSL